MNDLSYMRKRAFLPHFVALISFGPSFLAYASPQQDADLTLAPPGSPLTVLGKFSIAAMGSKVAVQTESVRVVGATSSFSNGTYPEGSVIPITVKFSVEVRTGRCVGVAAQHPIHCRGSQFLFVRSESSGCCGFRFLYGLVLFRTGT